MTTPTAQTPLLTRLEEAAASVRARVGTVPALAVVLGSGLGDYGETLDDAVSVPYGDLPHWPRSNVIGHAGKLVAGRRHGVPLFALSGRAHFYEGHPMDTVTFAVRVMGRLGVKTLIVTNAAGGIDTSFSSGTLMVIDDHINLLGTNPLIGPNDERLGVRFPDMTEVYSRRLRGIADEVGAARGVPLTHGVYIAVTGPSYETPAEIRAFRALGAHAVGMSTVPEAIVARHMGMEVLGISCITNMAAGVLPRPLDHNEVMDTARRVRGSFIQLLDGIVERA